MSFDAIVRQLEGDWIAKFEGRQTAYAAQLAAQGEAIVPALVGALEAPKPRPRTSATCLEALGMLGREPWVVSRWCARSSERLAFTAFCAMASIGEPGREAIWSLSGSKKKAERAAGEALVRVLDASELAPARALRANVLAPEALESVRDAIHPYEAPRDPSNPFARLPIDHEDRYRRLRVFLDTHGAAGFVAFVRLVLAESGESAADAFRSLAYVSKERPDLAWGVGVVLLETPLHEAQHLANYLSRHVLLQAGAAWGEPLAEVARALVTLPPYADDFVLGALAAGRAIPDANALWKHRDARAAAKKKSKK
ncbi:MAG: hypothetical protein H6721_03740 [Sandaracinus sp.]|nr:hypothetical protein [Sandaracinus sp.]MCB9631245.1 hypothetical protein [Sandaracinus sp.]